MQGLTPHLTINLEKTLAVIRLRQLHFVVGVQIPEGIIRGLAQGFFLHSHLPAVLPEELQCFRLLLTSCEQLLGQGSL